MQVAVIGCGAIANGSHIPSYLNNPHTQIKYFCDIIPERAMEAVQKYGCGIAVTDYREVLADPEVSAISICTPNDVHAPIAIAAMRAGLHVLCEKPAARTYEEALDMQAVQQETGMILNIGVVNRFSDSVNMIKKYIDSGKLGEVYRVYASFRAHRSIPGLGGAFTNRAVSGGGVLIDWGVHYLDIAMFCLGDPEVYSVSGEIFSKLGVDIENYAYTNMWAGPPVKGGIYDVEDSVTALIRTEGPTITVNGAWAENIAAGGETYIDFIGDKAGIRLKYGDDFTVYTAENGALVEYTPKFNSSDMYQREIDDFVNSIETGVKSPSHIETAIITAQMMQAIYDSAMQHREVYL